MKVKYWPMERKHTLHVLAAIIAIVLTGFIIWRISYHKKHVLGKMAAEDAEEIFGRSKISNCTDNIEKVTGSVFFGYLNTFLKAVSLDMAKSLITAGIPKENERSIAGIVAVIASQAACKKMFSTESPVVGILKVLESPRADALLKLDVDDLDSLFSIFGNVLIYKLLKDQATCEAYDVFKGAPDVHVKKLIRACGKYGDLRVEVKCKGQGSRCMRLHEFIRLELYFTCQFFLGKAILLNNLRYYRNLLPF
jgi:hypothetical protein